MAVSYTVPICVKFRGRSGTLGASETADGRKCAVFISDEQGEAPVLLTPLATMCLEFDRARMDEFQGRTREEDD